MEIGIKDTNPLKNYVIKTEKPGDSQLAIEIIYCLHEGRPIILSKTPRGKIEIYKEGYGRVYKYSQPQPQKSPA